MSLAFCWKILHTYESEQNVVLGPVDYLAIPLSSMINSQPNLLLLYLPYVPIHFKANLDNTSFHS